MAGRCAENASLYGRKQRGLQMARAMICWGRDIVLCTDGRSDYTADQRRALQRNGITLVEKRIAELRGSRGRPREVFKDGEALPRDTLFFDTVPCAIEACRVAGLPVQSQWRRTPRRLRSNT